MGTRIAALVLILTALFAHNARADMRSDAARLLAHRVRQSGADPKNLTIAGIVVVRDRALLSWDSGRQHGVMGLMVSSDRWWDALDMTAGAPAACWETDAAYPLVANAPYPGDAPASEVPPDAFPDDARLHPARRCAPSQAAASADLSLHAQGATLHPPRRFTSGYDFTLAYARNDAAADAKLAQIFARAPTHAEFAPSRPPAPGWGGPDAVCFFDVAVSGTKPVTFAPGTAIDIWFPFVLDDQLRYNLSFMSAGKPSGMIFGTIFDNTLHFVLPAFTLQPGAPLMAEIDGDPKGPS